MKKIFIPLALLFLVISLFAQSPQKFTDARDGNIYKYIEIGGQTWMAGNLRYTPQDINELYKLDCVDKRCSPERVQEYGLLYNFELAQNSCPSGWHLPSKAEFETLAEFIARQNNLETQPNIDENNDTQWNSIGEYLKNNEWGNEKTKGNYNFNAQPTGMYIADENKTIPFGGFTAYWVDNPHTSKEIEEASSTFGLRYGQANFTCYNDCPIKDKFSVRCIKDGSYVSTAIIHKNRTYSYYRAEAYTGDIFISVETQPYFPSDPDKTLQNYSAYIKRNIAYPALAKKNNISGNVLIKFVIDPEGYICNIELVRSADDSLTEEAMMLIMDMPRWQPGTLGGKPVAVEMILPVKFEEYRHE